MICEDHVILSIFMPDLVEAGIFVWSWNLSPPVMSRWSIHIWCVAFGSGMVPIHPWISDRFLETIDSMGE
jgi:hypothetical protein